MRRRRSRRGSKGKAPYSFEQARHKGATIRTQIHGKAGVRARHRGII